VPYPPENVGLLERVASEGAALSEFPLRAEPEPSHFPRRNRLIAALSLAVLVVEAGERSGALSTARHALDLGREVLAVPGPVDAEGARGTLRLLQEGAFAVGSAQDVFAALGWCGRAPPDLPPEERALLDLLAAGAVTAAEAAGRLSLREEAAAGLLLVLEIRGLATRGADGRYSAI
jgi:DNA processing protein